MVGDPLRASPIHNIEGRNKGWGGGRRERRAGGRGEREILLSLER